MARKAQRERKTTTREQGARPQTRRVAKKSVTEDRAGTAKKEAEKSAPAHRPEKMPSKEWLEALFFGLVVVHLQEFFRWCWEHIDKKQPREITIALYREIFFPFESMPEQKRLPIWRRRKVERFIRGLTSAQAIRLETVARQWAEETGQSVDHIRGDPE